MLLHAVKDLIGRQGLIHPGDRVVAAVSGGPDSVVMLHLLNRLRFEIDFSLHVAHLDHMFRGEQSRLDAEFVGRLAESMGLDHTVKAIDVPDYRSHHNISSAQEAARIVRYAFLAKTAECIGANVIAVAHNADDQVETVLQNLIRGAGPEGLRGMAYHSGMIARPLLDTSRADIEKYCDIHGLETRIDASNDSMYYTRNRIRHRLLPLLESFNPAVRQAVSKASRLLTIDDEYLDTLALRAYDELWSGEEERLSFPDEGLARLHPALRRRVLRLAVERIKGDLRDITLGHIEAMEALLEKNVGASADLPGLTVYRDYGRLVVGFRPPSTEDTGLVAELQVPGENLLPQFGIRIRIAGLPSPEAAQVTPGRWRLALDAAALPGPLAVRFRRPGDRIHPFGMTGSKKLQDLFVDAKIPRWQRGEVPLLTAGDEIVWVIGLRAGSRWLARHDTVESILLEAEPLAADRAL
ncbi:MAG: tRNA lysidine(34) synthetase TilS [bacterium]|nr:tRNA lysidine(34) synthetase TilS [bacterium]